MLCLSTTILGKVRDISTPRLDAMGGAGVGSILMDESTVLNPAPLAFFKYASFSYIHGSSTISEYDGQETLKEPSFKSYAITDATGGAKGGIRYSYQSEFTYSRKRISVNYAQPIGPRSAFGLLYHKTTEKEQGKSDIKEQSVDVGVLHALSKEFSIGVLVKDVFKKHKDDNKFSCGLQWVYMNFITLNLDFGFNYNYEISDTFVYRGGLQIMFFKDLFLRMGYFDDKESFSRGSSAGLSWLTPRLKFEVALKNTTFTKNIAVKNSGMKLKETSFTISYYY